MARLACIRPVCRELGWRLVCLALAEITVKICDVGLVAIFDFSRFACFLVACHHAHALPPTSSVVTDQGEAPLVRNSACILSRIDRDSNRESRDSRDSRSRSLDLLREFASALSETPPSRHEVVVVIDLHFGESTRRVCG